MKENKIIVELLAKLTYYAIIFLIYKYFGFEIATVYLLACLNTKLVKVYKK